MAFSHTIGGTTFTEASFEGNAYANETTGFAKAVEKMVEHVANAYRGTSTTDRKSTRLNSSHPSRARMPSSA